MLDDFSRLAAQPAVAAALWVGLALLLRWGLPKQSRVGALSPLAGVLGLALQPAFAILGAFGTSIIVALAQAAILWAYLTLFFAPAVLAVDRLIRTPLLTILSGRRRVAYSLAAATGLVTALAALVALWWVTDVAPAIIGSVELAVGGGVVAACLALVRIDRELNPVSSSGA